jgi:hypothetical protein
MWVLGGTTETAGKNDVWYSIDGTNWIRATDSAEWVERGWHTSIVFDNKMWVLGGWNNGSRNDLWYSTGLGIGEERTALDALCLTPEIYPNPAKSVIRVRIPFSDKGSRRLQPAIKIFDVSGKLIKEIATTASQSRNDRELLVSLKEINPGIYFLQLGATVRKFQVIR